MSIGPDMRAGDEDRDRTISVLRDAFAEGRITNEEFEQRLGQANIAKTFGELDVLVEDLPASKLPAPAAPHALPTPVEASPPDEQKHNHNVRNGWASWLGVSIMVNVIYFASWMSSDGGDSPPYYWPIWVMGPWGAAILIATLSKGDD